MEYASDGTATTNRYIYRDWLVLAITDGTGECIETYSNGSDLSGRLGGAAGGIGGVLSVSHTNKIRIYHHDYNGNIVKLTSPGQNILGCYSYLVFGETGLCTGTRQERYLFSSKEYNISLALFYYGYRYYSPSLGRWINRDPHGEILIRRKTRTCPWTVRTDDILASNGSSLYLFVQNNPIDQYDFLGLTVQNNCNHPICAKPEDGSEPILIQPNSSYDGKIDGVTDCDGNVVKITDPYNNSSVDVGRGGVDIPGPNGLGSKKLKCPPDDGWKDLFSCGEENQ